MVQFSNSGSDNSRRDAPNQVKTQCPRNSSHPDRRDAGSTWHRRPAGGQTKNQEPAPIDVTKEGRHWLAPLALWAAYGWLSTLRFDSCRPSGRPCSGVSERRALAVWVGDRNVAAPCPLNAAEVSFSARAPHGFRRRALISSFSLFRSASRSASPKGASSVPTPLLWSTGALFLRKRGRVLPTRPPCPADADVCSTDASA